MATTRLGRVDDGSSVLDYEPEEIKRKITISSAFHHYQWKKHSVYLADTPGDVHTIEAVDIPSHVPGEFDDARLAQAQAKLASMIGLEPVKTAIN